MIVYVYKLLTVLQWYIRPFVKWFLRKTTKLCELQRICYGDRVGAERTRNVEKSLRLSRAILVSDVVLYLDDTIAQGRFNYTTLREIIDPSVGIITRMKEIDTKLHPTFLASFGYCVEQIWCYKYLQVEIEALRQTPYDSNNYGHEVMLLELWSLLVPDSLLDRRVTKQWQHIGFQGDDPRTDFRGMGVLGLMNLFYFAHEYKKVARHVLSHSLHPKYGYTFAIVGINITSLAYQLLEDGAAKTYMFNDKHEMPGLNLFHKFYCYLFYEFDKMWIKSKPQNIMEFSIIFKKFEDATRYQLADMSSVFKINMEVDNI